MIDSDNIAVTEALSGLGDLSLEQFVSLSSKLEQRVLRGGETLLERGAQANTLYFVGTGRLIARDKTLGQSAILGWTEFIHGTCYDLEIHAERDSVVYSLAREAFDELVEQQPEFWRRFVCAASPPPGASKGEASDRKIAMLQIGLILSPGVDEAHLAKTLSAVENLKDFEHHVIEEAEVAELAGREIDEDLLAGPFASDLFSHLEQRYGNLLLVGRENSSAAWIQKIANQVDCLIVVTQSDCLEATAHQMAGLLRRLTRPKRSEVGLLIIDDEADALKRREALLDVWDVLSPDWHYKIRTGDDAPFKSAARMAAGRGVHLV